MVEKGGSDCNESSTAAAKASGDEQVARGCGSCSDVHRSFDQNFLQPAPVLFTPGQQPLWLGGIYRGRSVFLIAGGPSFASLDYSLLEQPGVLTMGLNNSAKTFRPNLWVCVDDPDHFIRSIWLDPTILKFVPDYHADKFIFNSDEWKFIDLRVMDCPNVVCFRCNEHFQGRHYGSSSRRDLD